MKESQMLLFSIISNILAKKAFIMNANNSSWVKSKTLSIFTIKRLWMVLFMSLLLAGCGNDNNSNDKAADEIVLKTIVAAVNDHSLVLSNDGRIYAAGNNDYGQLGLGDNNNRTVFTEVTDLKDKNIIAIVVGYSHSFALSNDSRVYAAGNNNYGQLGLGNNNKYAVFTEVSDLKDKNITAVATGRLHSLVLSNDGRVYATGNNDYGQLGLGNNYGRIAFTEVTDLKDKNITAVAAGYSHSFAISNDGKIYATGNNDVGQLGLGDNNKRVAFTEVSDLKDKNITAVAAGRSHSFAILNDGKIYAAGNNDVGQLGLGDNNKRNAFTEVSYLKDKNITAVVAGSDHSFAISNDSRVYAAGNNNFGQLGLGDNKGRNAFTEASDLSDKNITAGAAGRLHSLVLSNDGKIYAAGSNSVGQLGLGNRVRQNSFMETIIPNYQ
jgi:alpha-tubulin suppressor-like RCC1 family protein